MCLLIVCPAQKPCETEARKPKIKNTFVYYVENLWKANVFFKSNMCKKENKIELYENKK